MPSTPPEPSLPSYSDYSEAPRPSDIDESEALLATGTYPGAGKRFGGYIVDSILLGIVSFALTIVFAAKDFSRFSTEFQDWTDAGKPGDGPVLETGGILIAALLSLIIWFIYRISCEVRGGQTLGKKLLKMKVVAEDGSPLTFRASFKRNSWYIAVFLLSFFASNFGPFIALLLIAILGITIARNPQGQHTFDQWAKTCVVNIR